MKRIWIALAVAALVFGGAAWEISLVSRSVDEQTSRIERIDRLFQNGDTDGAARACAELEEDWSRTARAMDSLLIHDYVDGIGNSFARMRRYLENGSRAHYFAESAYTKKALASIKESEYPFFENIL